MQITQICGEDYSPRYNTQSFLPVHLHHYKRRMRTEDHHAPMPAAAATTCPTPFHGSPRWPPRGGGGGRVGVTVGVLNTVCELVWELTTTTRFRLPSGRVTRRARHSDYREMRSFLILFLICMFLSIHIFYCTCKKVCLLYISSRRTVYSVICTFESHSKLSSFVHT
jgi:hypothetical protein